MKPIHFRLAGLLMIVCGVSMTAMHPAAKYVLPHLWLAVPLLICYCGFLYLRDDTVRLERLFGWLAKKQPDLTRNPNLAMCKRQTAVHEAGHVIGAIYQDPPLRVKKAKITRDRQVGYTGHVSHHCDWSQMTKELMLTDIAQTLAGLGAEEMVFQSKTDGARNDLRWATDMTRRYVTRCGMSSLGLQYVDPREHQVSQKRLERIEEEVDAILEERHAHIMDVLGRHRRELELVADALEKHEELSGEEIEELLRAHP